MIQPADGRPPLHSLHDGEPPQRQALRGRDERLGEACVSTPQRRRLAVHGEVSGQDAFWYEHYSDINEAITREKQLKKWERRWKLELIESFNPSWADLYEEPPALPARPVI